MGRKGNRGKNKDKAPVVEEPQYNLSDFSPSTSGELEVERTDSDEEVVQELYQAEPEPPLPIENKDPKKGKDGGTKVPELDMELDDERTDPSKPRADVIPLVAEDTEEASTATAHLLIARVAGKFPGRKAIAEFIKEWNCVLSTHPSGWLILDFHTLDDLNSVMENGPYYIQGSQFVLQVMPELFDFRTDELFIVPLWVQFPNLPLQLWTKSALSKIASQFGKPIRADHKTRTKKRFSFARVLIEVDVSQKPLDSIKLSLPNGECIEQVANFEFWPKSCTTCKAIGHDTASCHRVNATQFSGNRNGKRRKPASRKNATTGADDIQGKPHESVFKKLTEVDPTKPGSSSLSEDQPLIRGVHKATGRRFPVRNEPIHPPLELAAVPPLNTENDTAIKTVQKPSSVKPDIPPKPSGDLHNTEEDGLKLKKKEIVHMDTKLCVNSVNPIAKPCVLELKTIPPDKTGKGGPSTSKRKC